MATRYISVFTSRPQEVKAYLYRTASVVEIFAAKSSLRSHKVLVKVEAEEHDVQYIAQYQADRLSSGLHGARVHETEQEALDYLSTF